MSDNIPGITKKSFWQRPEGVTGFIVAAGLVLAGGYLLYKALPYIITLFENMLYAGILLIVVGALVYVILDPKFRNLVWYLYKVLMRKITGAFVQIDPINIIKTYIDSLRDKREDMNGQITKLKGEIGKLKKIISDNASETDEKLRMARKAQEMGKNAEFIIYSREAGRLDESNKNLVPLQTRMEKMYVFLTKMYDSAGYLIQDMESEIRVKEKEYQAIRSSHSAIKSALNIINGNSDKKLMFDQAMEFIQDDMGRKLGEMERFMEMSTQFINTVDIQNGVYEEKGMEMLDKLNEKDFTYLLGESAAKNPAAYSNTDKPKDSGSYSNLFE
jgi:hypothetical protein